MTRRLEWAIRETFLHYLEAVRASITLEDGAERSAEGVLRFPVTSHGPDSVTTRGRFRALAHDGALDLRIDEPSLHRGPEGWQLEWTALDGRRPRARLLDPAPDPLPADYAFAEVALTSEGASLFAGNYSPWARMSTVRLTGDE